MDSGARRAVVNVLIGLAASTDYHDRADAGVALARFAEMPETRGPLLELLLDPDNTYVTRATAEALLRRNDPLGLASVALALAGADLNHVDWIHTAVLDVFAIFADERDAAVRICEELAQENAENLRPGALELREILTEINPVLRPAS
jgi:hypothetical protein